MGLKKYSNLHLWVPELDEKVEEILAGKIEEILKRW